MQKMTKPTATHTSGKLKDNTTEYKKAEGQVQMIDRTPTNAQVVTDAEKSQNGQCTLNKN